MKMKILLLGSGGREHALAWKIAQSPKTEKLYIAPGNAGTAQEGENVDIKVTDFEAVASFVKENKVDMLVVGPEQPLVDGIADHFKADEQLRDVAVIGPDKQGATLEGSKEFAKDFMTRHNIPTARYKAFTPETLKEGEAFIDTLKAPYVLKADGLAAGKGVLIEHSAKEARRALRHMLGGQFGEASGTVVIEEFLDGIECSVFILTDGSQYVILPEAKDYKRIGVGDKGLNTGGMGSVTPVPFADEEFMGKVEERIIRPTVEGLREEGADYRGFIFFGLMNVKGDPYVIEYNVRMGDPETESVMMRLDEDLVELFEQVGNKKLAKRKLKFDPRSVVCTVCVSGGYPESYEKGFPIYMLDEVKDSKVFHCGTKLKDGKIVTNGGRVLAVCAMDNDLKEARKMSYNDAERIMYKMKYFRSDIAKDI